MMRVIPEDNGPDDSSRAGASLIELLVAITVASLMFVAMTNVLSDSVKSLRVLQTRIEMTQQARLVLGRMSRELASAFHPFGMYSTTGTRSPKPWLVVQPAGTGVEEISFIANLNQKDEFEPAPGYADLTELHYHVVTSGGQTHLYRRQDEGRLSTIAASYWSGGNDVMIAQNVRSLDFTVWDRDGAPAAGSGTYTYTGSEAGFPSRVRIKVMFYDPDGAVDDMPFVMDVSTMRNTANLP